MTRERTSNKCAACLQTDHVLPVDLDERVIGEDAVARGARVLRDVRDAAAFDHDAQRAVRVLLQRQRALERPALASNSSSSLPNSALVHVLCTYIAHCTSTCIPTFMLKPPHTHTPVANYERVPIHRQFGQLFARLLLAPAGHHLLNIEGNERVIQR